MARRLRSAVQGFAALRRRGIKVDPLAHELATSEGNRLYLDCVVKAYRNNAVGLEAALQVVRDLPLEKAIYVASVVGSGRWTTRLGVTAEETFQY
jgi:hypothetical protein